MTSPRWAAAACACLIFATVGCFQFFHHSYATEFANHPDEAAHFVTGVCTLDYLTSAFGSGPRTFVESYYVRYPKVAFGHWPPLFYAIQAIWYALLGATAFNAMLLNGAIAAMAAVVLFLRLRSGHGDWTAAFSVAVFLWLPQVRIAQQLLMADMLAGLFLLLAVFSFCDALRQPGLRRSLVFALWASAAILTKESGWLLVAFAPAAWVVLKSERPALGRQIGLTILAVSTSIVLIYSFAGVWSFRNRPFSGDVQTWWTRLQSERLFFSQVSPLVFLVAAYGIFSILRQWRARKAEGPAALVWLGIALLLPLLRGGEEARYFVPALFPLIILFAQGLHEIAASLRGRAAPIFAGVLITFLALATMPRAQLSTRTGYREIAASMPYDSPGASILISSDASGEGALIAERLMHDRYRDGVVLRASKMLRSSDWMGGHEKLLARSTDEVRGVLDSIPVNYVVVDMNGFPNESARLLARAMQEAPGQFRLIGSFPLYFDGHPRDRSVEVYENLSARHRRPDRIRMEMKFTLGRDLDVPLQPGGVSAGRPVAVLSRKLASFLDKPAPQVDALFLRIHPAVEDADAEGDSGRIYVTAPHGFNWPVSNVPDWITIPEGTRSGDGEVQYLVSRNRSNAPRAAAISIGGETFFVRQPRASHVYIPYLEKFTDEGGWMLEDSAGKSTLQLSADAPAAGSSLVLNKDHSSDESSATQLSLLGIETPDTRYRVSMWLKAENPGLVAVGLGRTSCASSEPIWVPAHWIRVSAAFELAKDCGTGYNRLSIGAGRIAGKLWIAEISLIEDTAGDGPGQQADRKRQSLQQIPF